MVPAQFQNRFLLGDCIEGMRQVPDGCVPLAIADCPYNVGYSYDVYEDNRKDADYLAWSREWLTEVKRVLASDGTFWLVIGNEYVSELDWICKRELGLYPRAQIPWVYGFGQANAHGFNRCHATLLYYVKNKDHYYFDDTAVRVPSARQLIYNDKRANPAGKLPDDVWFLRPQEITAGLPAHGDVWHCPRVAGTFKTRQPTPNHLPEQLLKRPILMTSRPGDLVLDPFGGSGTTAAVAKKLDRSYLSWELSPTYHAAGLARVDAAQVGEALAGPGIQE